jgi:hypothetical protein
MRLLLPCALFALCLPALAQPPEVKRVLHTFDFEERRLGNKESLPMFWEKVQGPGLPHYVNGRLAEGVARSGTHSFRFDLNGGGLAYRYAPGRIRVQPGAHYRVEAWCRTTVLPNARARLGACFTDIDGHPLAATLRHSEPYAATSPEEGWRRLSVDLSADDARAASLVVELGLLQPQQFAGSTLGTRTLHTQDIRGSAWFDDVTVAQVPQVTVRTDRPGNIFRRGEPLRLQVLLNDRFVDDLSARVLVKDALGKTVYQRTSAPELSPAESGPVRTTTVQLPDLPPGWYEASLSLSSGGQFVGGQTLSLFHLADDDTPDARTGSPRTPSRVTDPDGRFGIVATDLPPEGWERLPEVLPMLSAGRVKLALWGAGSDVQQVDAAKFDRLVERLQAMGITPTGVLAEPPPAVAASLKQPGWAGLLSAPRDAWQPQLAYLVSRHANHLDRWQLGLDGSDAFVSPAMREVYAQVYKEVAALVQSPDLAMPWPAWYELDGQAPATVALSVPPSVLPSQLPLYVQDLKDRKGHELSLSLQIADRATYGREVQIRDLAERVIYALAAGAKRIDLPLPFNVSVGEDGGVVEQPQELLMVVRTLTATLGGTTFRGKVPIADGVEAFLFDKNGQGIIALWDAAADGRSDETRTLPLNLGQRPVSVDLWGNVTPLFRTAEQRKDGKVPVKVGAMPVFLVDVDGEMAQLRASVAIDRPLLESSFEPHARRLRFTNPYRQTIGGMVKLKAPPGWTLSPPTFTFSLNPGETFERELRVEFPYNSFAGEKTLVAEFSLGADAASAFDVPIPLKLGLSDVGMQTLALRDGDDVVVQQMVSNYGDRPIDYTAFALFPGQARQERLVTKLAAGRTTVKKYRFKGVGAGESKVRVGLKELSGTRVLNDEVEIR